MLFLLFSELLVLIFYAFLTLLFCLGIFFGPFLLPVIVSIIYKFVILAFVGYYLRNEFSLSLYLGVGLIFVYILNLCIILLMWQMDFVDSNYVLRILETSNVFSYIFCVVEGAEPEDSDKNPSWVSGLKTLTENTHYGLNHLTAIGSNIFLFYGISTVLPHLRFMATSRSYFKYQFIHNGSHAIAGVSLWAVQFALQNDYILGALTTSHNVFSSFANLSWFSGENSLPVIDQASVSNTGPAEDKNALVERDTLIYDSHSHANTPILPSNDQGNSDISPANDPGNSDISPANDPGSSAISFSNDPGSDAISFSNDEGNSPKNPFEGRCSK